MMAQTDQLSEPGADVLHALTGEWRAPLERDLLPRFLAAQRWFGAKDQSIQGVSLEPLAEMTPDCALCAVHLALSGESQRYFLPLAMRPDSAGAGAVAEIAEGRALVDGVRIPEVARAILDAMRAGRVLRAGQGELRFEGTQALGETVAGAPRLLDVEQSNASVLFGQEIILKIYRRLRHGVQPDVEMARHLTRTGGFAQTPAYLGSAALHEGDDVTVLAAAFAFVPNRGDAWSYLTGLLAQADVAPDTGTDLIRRLGQRTGDLHRALARPGGAEAFAPEPIAAADLAAWAAEAQEDLAAALNLLEAADLDRRAAPLARRVLAAREDLSNRIGRVADLAPSGQRTRIHGDYHLGQVLVTEDDVAIIDFEGEPRRPLAARRAKTAPLRDVAGMIRSLDYAARSVIAADGAADDWRRQAVKTYLGAYAAAVEGDPSQPEPELGHALLDLFLVQKAAYEIGYELANRPGWAHLPLAGLVALMEGGTTHD